MIKIYSIKINDVNLTWVNWLNTKKVNKYSNQRHKVHTYKSQKNFIKKKLASNTSRIFKIIYKNKFVGVIELKNIDRINKCSEMSYMIGETKVWGNGIASKAINLLLVYSKKKLKLNKIVAAIVKSNIGSQKVLKNNGFKKFGEIKNFYKFNKKLINKVFYIKDLI